MWGLDNTVYRTCIMALNIGYRHNGYQPEYCAMYTAHDWFSSKCSLAMKMKSSVFFSTALWNWARNFSSNVLIHHKCGLALPLATGRPFVSKRLWCLIFWLQSINLERKQLYQQWNSSIIGMRRRDEAHAAMQEALRWVLAPHWFIWSF